MLDPSPMASDLVSYAYVMETHKNPKVQRVSGLVNPWRCGETSEAGEGLEASHHLPIPYPILPLHVAVLDLYPFILKLEI